MDFRFEGLLGGRGAGGGVDWDAMRLLESFAENFPGVGAAVGADLRAGILEATFIVRGSLSMRQPAAARQMLLEAATASGLKSINLINLAGEAEGSEQALAS